MGGLRMTIWIPAHLLPLPTSVSFLSLPQVWTPKAIHTKVLQAEHSLRVCFSENPTFISPSTWEMGRWQMGDEGWESKQ